MQTANEFELRLALTEEIARELLWRALAPESTSMFGALNEAIAQQAELLGVSTDGYQVSGVSVTNDPDGMYAEISYMQRAA
jgi:hypothetical protein